MEQSITSAAAAQAPAAATPAATPPATASKLQQLAQPAQGRLPLNRQSVLVHGVPKVGKSTLVSQVTNAVVIDLENGYRNIEHPFIVRAKTWKELRERTSLAISEASSLGLEAIVIDPVSKAWEYAVADYLEKNNIQHMNMGVGAYGVGKGTVQREFADWFNEVLQSPLGSWFVSHSHTVAIPTPAGELNKRVPRMDAPVYEVVPPSVDLILFLDQVGGEGMIYTKPTDTCEAGDRTKPGLPPLLPLRWDVLELAYRDPAGYNTWLERRQAALVAQQTPAPAS